MQDATIARGEDLTSNVRGDEDTLSMHLLQGQRDPKPSGAPGEKHIAKQRCPDTLQKCSDRDTSCLHAPQQHSVPGDGFIPPPAFTSGEAFATGFLGAGIGGNTTT